MYNAPSPTKHSQNVYLPYSTTYVRLFFLIEWLVDADRSGGVESKSKVVFLQTTVVTCWLFKQWTHLQALFTNKNSGQVTSKYSAWEGSWNEIKLSNPIGGLWRVRCCSLRIVVRAVGRNLFLPVILELACKPFQKRQFILKHLAPSKRLFEKTTKNINFKNSKSLRACSTLQKMKGLKRSV